MKSDGTPYGPERFKQIVKERYYVSKYTNTSYQDVGQMTPLERRYVLEFISDELKKQKELLEKKQKKVYRGHR